MSRGAMLLTLVGSLLAGCGDDDEPQANVAGAVEENTNVTPGATSPQPSWKSVETGTSAPVAQTQDAYVVVRDSVAWNFLHRWTHGAWTEVPAVNFKKSVVVGAFLGQRASSGYAVSVLGVQWGPSDATVTIQEKVPGPNDVVILTLTRPYALARLTAPVGSVVIAKGGQAPVVAAEKNFTILVREDFARRPFASWTNPKTEDVSYLNGGLCPLDKTTPLVKADLGTFAPSTAHYCVNHGKYWVHRQPYMVNGPEWVGPCVPGTY